MLVAAAAQPDIAVLEPTSTIERELGPRQEHLYQLAVARDECVTVVVEHRGIDVALQARRPDNRVIADIQLDVTPAGQERVDLVAETAGTYVIAVKSGPGVRSGAYTIRIAGRRAATDADRAMQEVWALRTTASGLRSAAKFAEAKSRLERAVAAAEGIRGANDVLVGILLTDLAGTALSQRDDATAEPLLQRALTILEKAWGTEHPYPAYVRSRLSLVEQHAGHGPQAEVLLRDAIQVLERTVGAEHPWTVACLSNQGILRNLAGDPDRAIEIYVRVLSIHEKLGDTNTANYAGALSNLGDLYQKKKNYAGAEELMLRSLAITEKGEGAETFHASILYQSLGIVAREQKDYARAMSYYSRALSIRERLLGPDHPDVAPILNNIGGVQAVTGDLPGAIETFARAARILEKLDGPGNPTAVLAVGNIARAYASQGNIAAALEFQRRTDEIIEKQTRLNLSAVGSERERLAFMNSIAVRTDRTISLSLREAAGDVAAARQAALVLLQRKGRVLDAMTDTFAAVRKRVVNPREREALDELRTTAAQLARLALSASTPTGDIQNSIEKLKALQERLETDLSVYSSELCAQLHTVTLAAVQAAIPERAALIEIAVFRPFDPKAWSDADAYGPPRYAAFVIHRNGTPQGFDLGAVSEIDSMVAALRWSLRDPARTDVKEQARALDRRVLQPLRRAFGDVTRLLISPDGQLNLVPFETFVDEQGRYLVENYATSYLTSGRDLLNLPGTPASESTAIVVVADPLFGEPGITGVEPRAAKLPVAQSARRSVTIGDDLSSMYFAPLSGTAAEARIIGALFPHATMLTGRNATKAAIERLAAPRILHIASHGFFVQRNIDNPLLRSGLALAGANVTHDPDAAGILTALEASSLNLWGTRLVTLSACDTGVGEVRNGEGVYGLRRAFVLAGAETLVMSLWPVSDYISREVMQEYYGGLHDGLGRGDALRQAKLTLLKRKSREHPFYWASFIQSGEWANLDGKR